MGELCSRKRAYPILSKKLSRDSLNHYLLELRQSNLLLSDEVALLNFVGDCVLCSTVTQVDIEALQKVYDAVQARKGYGSA